MNYIIGSRGSKLALIQSNAVKEALEKCSPEHTFEIKIIKTSGEKFTDTPLKNIGINNAFTKEIEEQLLSGEIDLAIHSMKDLGTQIPEGLEVKTVLERADVRDVLISKDGKGLMNLKKGAVVATGSLRRKYQLLAKRPDLSVVDIRGNVETRIRKLHENDIDAIVLAAAGVKRLGIEENVTEYFSIEDMVPAATQGTLAAEFASLRADVKALVAQISNEKLQKAAEQERRILAELNVGCHTPIGLYFSEDEGGFKMCSFYAADDGSNAHFYSAKGTEPSAVTEDILSKMI